jgi:hypothetical protein
MMLLLLGTALATAVVAAEPLVPGMTFGTGIAGIPICQEPRVVVNYTLSSGSSHGVLHHFVSVHAPSAPHCSTHPLGTIHTECGYRTELTCVAHCLHGCFSAV